MPDSNVIPYHSTGIARIDSQHAMLTSLYTETTHILQEGNMTPELFRQFLGTLKGYIAIHFITEAKYFKIYKYQEQSTHNELHEEFYDWIESVLIKYFVDSGMTLQESSILDSIQEWFNQHSETADKEFASFLARVNTPI